MTAIAYSSLLPEIVPQALGVPRIIAEREIRNTVIDVCKESGVWQHEFTSFDSIAGIEEYILPFGSMDVPAEMNRPVWVLYDGERLQPISYLGLEQKYPKWRTEERYGNKPLVFVQKDRETIIIVPKPILSVTGVITVRAELKPTRGSRTTDKEIFEEYHEIFVSGTLARLLQQPNKSWTNNRAAQAYGARYLIQRDEAKAKAARRDQGILRTVTYGGVSASLDRTQQDVYQHDYFNTGYYNR